MNYNRTESPLYALMLSGKQYTLPKGQLVSAFEDDNLFYLIEQGYIKRYRITNDGEKSVQVIYGPGDVLPLTPVYKAIFKMDIYSGPERYFYEAICPLSIYVIPHTKLLASLDVDPTIYKDLFYVAGLRLDSYIHRLESLSMRSAHCKIAHQLVFLANSFGVATDIGIALSLPITHQDIGDILGMARETVSRAVTELTAKGLLMPGRSVVITDLSQLKIEAGWTDS